MCKSRAILSLRLYGVLEEQAFIVFILFDSNHRPSTFFLPQSLQQTSKLKIVHSRSFGEESMRKTYKVCSRLLYNLPRSTYRFFRDIHYSTTTSASKNARACRFDVLQRASVDSEAKLKKASSDNFKPAWFQRVANGVNVFEDGHLAIHGDTINRRELFL